MDVYLRVRRAVMVEGMNIREAARTFGLDRDTVRKMLAYSVPPGYRGRLLPEGTNVTFEGQLPPYAGLSLRPSPPGGCFFAIGAPTGHSQPPAAAESNRTPRW